jgi:hypothetical protein
MVKLALTNLGIFINDDIAGIVVNRNADTEATFPFSLESWASAIVVDPEGAHLSPDEAFALTVNQAANGKGHNIMYETT